MNVRWKRVVAFGLMTASGLAQGPKKLLDVMRVSVEGDAGAALVTPRKGPVREVSCEVVIVGAGLGGVSAALAATKAGHTVCMTEPTLWVGGQATSQGVSAFDDNKWIDTTGGTASYLDLSHRIRAYYAGFRRDRAISEEASIQGSMANPGGCWVGRLCFEPEPAERILREMLQPAVASGRLKLWVHTVPVSVKKSGRAFESVLVYDFGKAAWVRLRGHSMPSGSHMSAFLPWWRPWPC